MGPGSFAFLLQLSLLLAVSECHRYMGCYKENSGTARLMGDHQKIYKGTLTPETCISHCKSKGFNYAGVQYGFECFCSKERPSFKHFADPAECNTKCEGDNSKICGGGWRLSVYDILNKRVNYVQPNYEGCFADDGDRRRALRDKVSPESNDMTPEYCAGYCYNYGYRYSGVQYKRQCFCGNEIKGEKVNEDECDQDCAGNSRLICGGAWKNSIYHTSISDESEDGRMIGCFHDSDDLRLLSGHKMVLSETNSPRRCMNICLQLGFKYAGVEYGIECFCGNKTPDAGKEAAESECQGQCPRSNQRTCGGNWRISVYSTSPTAPTTVHHRPPIVIVPGVGNQVPKVPVINPADVGQPLSINQQTQTSGRPPVQHTTTHRTTTERWTAVDPSTCSKSKTEHAGKQICEGELLFHEKFNSWTPGVWKHEIFMPDSPDYEFVVFDDNRENIFLDNDGNLVIKPSIFEDEFVRRGRLRLDKCTGRMFTEECEREGRTFALLPPVRSARITTKDSFSFKYGKVVVKARLPAGDWLVPEIWLEPKDRIYGPGYQSGRIRIATSFGNSELSFKEQDIGSKRLESGILMATENRIRGRKRLRLNERNRAWYEDFHNYTLIWTPDRISFQIDDEEEEDLVPPNSGKLYNLVGFDRSSAGHWDQGTTLAPFDQEFYISLGMSVGGMREFPDNCVTGQGHVKPWTNMAVKGLVDFWNDRFNWYPTWSNNKFGLQIADVIVYAL